MKYLMSVFLLLLIVAQSPKTNIITTIPTKPISTVVFKNSDPEEYIIKYANKGYVVQSMSSYGDHYYGYTVVVMAKY